MAERVRLARRPALHSGALFRYTPGMDPTGMSVSRPYQGTYRDQFGTFRTAPAGVLRDMHYTLDPVTGIYRRSTLLEPQSTNLLLRSTDVAAEPWGAHPSLTPSPAVSCIAGQTARMLTAAGTTVDPFVYQTAGTFTGSAETATMIVERGTDTQALLGIYDLTTGTWVYRARLDYATGIVTKTHGTPGTASARLLAQYGPNGGEVWELVVTSTGTAGNSRRVYGCPVGAGGLLAGTYGTIHYIGLEAGAISTSPIVTTDTPVSRPHDEFSVPWPHDWCPMAGFSEFIAGMNDNGGIILPRILHIGATDGSHPSFQVRHGPGVIVTVAYATSTDYTAASGGGVVNIVVGDRVRIAWALRNDAKVYTAVQVNTGQVSANTAANALSGGIPVTWPKQPWIQFSGWSASNRGRHEHLCHYVCRLSSVANQPGVALPADFLAEMAAKAGAA